MLSTLQNYSLAQMNEKHLFPERLIITNNEMALSEAQVKQHFNSIDQLSAAIAGNPDNALNYYSRALDFYLVQDFDNALNDLNECVERDSTFFPAYFSRALIHYKELEYKKREKSFEIVVADDKTAHTLLGLLAAGNENCCLQEIPRPAQTATANSTADMFSNDEELKKQEEAARIAKLQREKEERERKERERKEKERLEKEAKKKKKKDGPSWFEKTFNKLSNEIFSDEDMK